MGADAAGAGPLVFVGFRRGALRAARALGRPAVALVAPGGQLPAAPELDGARAVDLHGPFEPILSAARVLLDGRTPAAVVALAERTVLVAAQLRDAFGLDGNDPATALRCADKVEMKRAMDAAGVAVAPWRTVGPATSPDELIDALGLPLVLKPRRDSGGRGQRKLVDAASVGAALADLARADTFETSYGWLAEGWVTGAEMSVESFVDGGRAVFHNPTEYYVQRHANILPAALPDETWRELRTFAGRALRATGVTRGITHLELFQTASGPVFGELAARPPGGRLMTLLASAWGFDPWEALLRVELGESPTFPATPARTSGVWILHPGAGRVTRIAGQSEARALPHVRRVVLKVDEGATIPARQGSGQDIGSIYADGPDRDAVAHALERAHETLLIELE